MSNPLEFNQNKYRVFDNLIEGVQVISHDWKYFYVNNTVVKQGKSTLDELLGQTMMEKYPGIEETDMFKHLKKCMLERCTHQMINEFEFPDHTTGYFELRMQPVEEGVLILSFDVTNQKQHEKFLRTTNKELDTKVRDQIAELLAKNKEMEQFAYVASHDLQEPLRTISNYVQVFKEDYSGVLDSKALEYLDSMSRAVQKTTELAKGLLDFSRLGKDVKIQRINCYDTVNEVLHDLNSIIVAKEATIELEKLPELNAYNSELKQVFKNLISNALKFSKKDTKPVINISSENLGNKWKFTVADNGIGIAPKHFERIFYIFQKLHLSHEYEGSGIGLANCKKIVILHGGVIWVESVLGKGSKFHFTISKL